MTRIFARPNAAFFAYERSLMRPRSWPPTTHDAPTLWERAKAMLAVLLETICSAGALARRAALQRAGRRDILARLAPVEKLTRVLLVIEAATFLLMTPEGARLRREAKTIAPPAPPPPVGVRKASHKTTIVMPGWQTIAALRPRIDPRVAEREARQQEQARSEALARLAAGADSLVQDIAGAPGPDAPLRDPHDPQYWRCRFRVLGWVHPFTDEPARAARGKRRVWIASPGEPDPYPLTPQLRVQRRDAPEHTAPESMAIDGQPAAIALARRIEALARVLANPGPAIRRLARRLAALPPDVLEPPSMRRIPFRDWWHGIPEAFNACTLAAPAVRALDRACAGPPPEPG